MGRIGIRRKPRLPVSLDFAGFRNEKGAFRRLFHSMNGGANRDRTDDLLHAMQALSQLSYSPTY